MLKLLAFLQVAVVSCSSDALIVGADRLLKEAEYHSALEGRTVGVVSNPTGVLSDLTHLVDALVDDSRSSNSFELRCVFGPEHGFRGNNQDGHGGSSYIDNRTGLQVYAAYGLTDSDLSSMIEATGIDTIVFDIQDVGVRFYTFIWSMFSTMRAAANVSTDMRFIVLDRPNPLGGDKAEGPMLVPEFASGIGRAPIPLKHGMTIGELANFFNNEFLPQPEYGGLALNDLRVVPMLGWSRDDRCDAWSSNTPWVMPSPNMPTCLTATVYPGMGFFEGTNMSEGRGTTRPFEIVGAPFANWHLSENLRHLKLPGVIVREANFIPTFNKFIGETCGGIQLHVTDLRRFDALRVALHAIIELRNLYPSNFGWRMPSSTGRYYFDLLVGSNATRLALEHGDTVETIAAAWEADTALAKFRKLRQDHLLYTTKTLV